MFSSIHHPLSKLPHFQIIIMEHANLGNNERFQNSLVEEPWTDGKALIPENWISRVETKNPN